MTGLPTSLIVPAGTAIRLPVPAGSDPGDGPQVRPIPAVFPAPPQRDETRARQDPAEDRGSRVRAEQRSFGQTRPRQTSRQASGPAFAALAFTAPALAGNSPFLAQVLSQDLGPAGTVVALHRDGPALGSDAYRRAGGEPVLYSEQPQLLRIAV